MNKISVTTLEQFRRYMDDVSDKDTEQAVIDRMKLKHAATDKTRIGSAWHKLIEDKRIFNQSVPMVYEPGEKVYGYMATGKKEWIVSESIAFPLAEALKAKAYRDQHKLMISEVPITKEYVVDGIKLTVSGRVDGLEGRHVRDAKVRFAELDINTYLDSIQWMLYLDMLGCSVLHYDVFEVAQPVTEAVMPRHGSTESDLEYKKTGGYKIKEAGGIKFLHNLSITAHEPISCPAYSYMGEEIMDFLQEFMRWVKYRKLEQYLIVEPKVY